MQLFAKLSVPECTGCRTWRAVADHRVFQVSQSDKFICIHTILAFDCNVNSAKWTSKLKHGAHLITWTSWSYYILNQTICLYCLLRLAAPLQGLRQRAFHTTDCQVFLTADARGTLDLLHAKLRLSQWGPLQGDGRISAVVNCPTSHKAALRWSCFFILHFPLPKESQSGLQWFSLPLSTTGILSGRWS